MIESLETENTNIHECIDRCNLQLYTEWMLIIIIKWRAAASKSLQTFLPAGDIERYRLLEHH